MAGNLFVTLQKKLIVCLHRVPDGVQRAAVIDEQRYFKAAAVKSNRIPDQSEVAEKEED